MQRVLNHLYDLHCFVVLTVKLLVNTVKEEKLCTIYPLHISKAINSETLSQVAIPFVTKILRESFLYDAKFLRNNAMNMNFPSFHIRTLGNIWTCVTVLFLMDL